MATKMAAKIGGKLPFWSKFETCNRGINIEHKQIQKKKNFQMMRIITVHNISKGFFGIPCADI